MTGTPSIPSWMREFRHEGYTNVFSLLPGTSALYGTETLFGDWDAPLLLLAKDGAPTHVISTTGWRHADRAMGDKGGWRTNDRLRRLVASLPGAECLYGSATANMLYDDPKWSRALPGFWRGPLNDYLVRVLSWVVGSMQNVRVISCLGNEAWYLSCMAMQQAGVARQWANYRDRGQTFVGVIANKTIMLVPHYHPAARISLEKMQRNWRLLATLLASKV